MFPLFMSIELIESVMYLYRATGDSYLLEIGEDMLRSIQYSAKTSCGFATVRWVVVEFPTLAGWRWESVSYLAYWPNQLFIYLFLYSFFR